MLKYREALAWLLSLPDSERKPTPRPSHEALLLERPTALVQHLGNPQNQYRSVLIAGTKGKGSTAAMLESIVRAAGYKTGLYTSPHLHTYRERICVNGEMISENDFARLVEFMRPIVDEILAAHPPFESLTTFEVMTAIALQHFAESHVQIAIVEVGMGGRLDATNVVEAELSIITSISFDHMAVLGNTLAQIANEKAGIIKIDGVALSAPQAVEALQVIERVAGEKRALLGVGGRDWSWSGTRKTLSVRAESSTTFWKTRWQLDDLYIPLYGAHQFENAATAVVAARVLGEKGLGIFDQAIRAGLAATHWMGRIEILQARDASHPLVIVDGAHNGDSAEKLVRALESEFEFEKLWLIFGVLGDKDLAAIAAPFIPQTSYVWTVQTRHPRSRDAQSIATQLATLGLRAEPVVSTQVAIQRAQVCASPRDLILLTGSLSIVAEGRGAFGRGEFETI